MYIYIYILPLTASSSALSNAIVHCCNSASATLVVGNLLI